MILTLALLAVSATQVCGDIGWCTVARMAAVNARIRPSVERIAQATGAVADQPAEAAPKLEDFPWLLLFRSDAGSPRVAVRVEKMPADARLEFWDDGGVTALTAGEIRVLLLERAAKSK